MFPVAEKEIQKIQILSRKSKQIDKENLLFYSH